MSEAGDVSEPAPLEEKTISDEENSSGEETEDDDDDEEEEEDEEGDNVDEKDGVDEDDSDGNEESEKELDEDEESDEDDNQGGNDEEDEEEESEDEEEIESDKEKAMESSDDENCDRCPICLNRLRTQDMGTPESCDHVFCLECIQEWARVTNTCPVDRQVFNLILARHALEEKIFKKFSVENNKQGNEEEEEDPTYCEVCGQSDREDRLLLCDGCDLGYHCECLDPPLSTVPVQEWFCPDCHDRRAGVTVEEPHLLGRQIARTRISERVRRIIADARAERAERRRRVAAMIISQETLENGEFGPTASTSTTTSASPRKRKVTRKKRTTKKRKTRKRKTTKRRTTKSKKGKTKRKRKTKGKKKRKTKKTRTTKNSSGLPALARTARSGSSVKSRIADKLGLSQPPVGRSIPLQKVPTGSRQEGVGRSSFDSGTKTFSILGSKDELYLFADQEGEERQILHRPAIPVETLLSRSAKSSRLPLKFSVPKRKIEVTESPAASVSAPSVSSFDLLGSIMQNQDLLHKGSKHVIINRDGSLSAAALNSTSVKNSPVKSSSPGSSQNNSTESSVTANQSQSSQAQKLNHYSLSTEKISHEKSQDSLCLSTKQIGDFQKLANFDGGPVNCKLKCEKGEIVPDCNRSTLKQEIKSESIDGELSENSKGHISPFAVEDSTDDVNFGTSGFDSQPLHADSQAKTTVNNGERNKNSDSVTDNLSNGSCEGEDKDKLLSLNRDREEGEASDSDCDDDKDDQEEGEIVDDDEDLDKKAGMDLAPLKTNEGFNKQNELTLETDQPPEKKKKQDNLDMELCGEVKKENEDVALCKPFSLANFLSNLKSAQLDTPQEEAKKNIEEEELKKPMTENEDKSGHMISILDFIGNESAKKFGLPDTQETKVWEKRGPGIFRSQPDGPYRNQRGRRQDNWSSRWRHQEGEDNEMDGSQVDQRSFNNRRRFSNTKPYMKGTEGGGQMIYGTDSLDRRDISGLIEDRRRSDSQDSKSSSRSHRRKESKDRKSESPRRKDKRRRGSEYNDDEDGEIRKKLKHDKVKKRSRWEKVPSESPEYEKNEDDNSDKEKEENKIKHDTTQIPTPHDGHPQYPPPPVNTPSAPYPPPVYTHPQAPMPLPQVMHYGQPHPQPAQPGQTPYGHPAYPAPNGQHSYPHSVVPAHMNPRHPYPGMLHPSYPSSFYPPAANPRAPSLPPAVPGARPPSVHPHPHPAYVAPPATVRPSIPVTQIPVNSHLQTNYPTHALPQVAGGNLYARPPYPLRPLTSVPSHSTPVTCVPVYSTTTLPAAYAQHQQVTSHQPYATVPHYTHPTLQAPKPQAHSSAAVAAPVRAETVLPPPPSHVKTTSNHSSKNSAHSKRDSSTHVEQKVKSPEEIPKRRRPSSYCISPPKPTIKGVNAFDKVDSSILLSEVKKGFRQLVEDAVRCALKSAWSSRKITKDEYKDIFKRAVEKVCGSNETVVHQEKIQSLVTAYVIKTRKARTSSQSSNL
ncbi:PHD and RING finger domain-containing protein 1 [Bulinus truncatus]|nr:PHD and RING finger domain-containing protein 1 [Bulinus truncatus]